MEKNVEISMLLGFYGSLLTKTQRFAIKEHYDEDLSFGEIAEQIGKSRQAVHDALKKGVLALYNYEKKLGILKRYLLFDENIHTIKNKIRRYDDNKMIVKELDGLLTLWEENDGV